MNQNELKLVIKMAMTLKNNGAERDDIFNKIREEYDITKAEAGEVCRKIFEAQKKSGKDYPVMITTKEGELKPKPNNPDNFQYFITNTMGYKVVKFLSETVFVNIDTQEMCLYDNDMFSEIVTQRARKDEVDFAKDDIEDFLTSWAKGQPEFLKEWAYSSPWDGKDRITELYYSLDPREDCEFQRLVFKKWFHGMPTQALNIPHPDSPLQAGSSEFCLILQDKREGTGKSKISTKLCPSFHAALPLHNESRVYFSKDDSVAKANLVLWSVSEIDEMLTNSHFGAIKEFMTSQNVLVREVYKRKPKNWHRTCTFVASTNATFLFPPDEKDLRRFAVIKTGDIDYTPLSVEYHQQLWAQVIQERKEGFKNWFSEEERAINRQRNDEYIKVGSAGLFTRNQLVKLGDEGSDSAPEYGMEKMRLYNAYAEYCISNHLTDKKLPPAFEESLLAQGYRRFSKVTRAGKEIYFAVRLKTSAETKEEYR